MCRRIPRLLEPLGVAVVAGQATPRHRKRGVDLDGLSEERNGPRVIVRLVERDVGGRVPSQRLQGTRRNAFKRTALTNILQRFASLGAHLLSQATDGRNQFAFT